MIFIIIQSILILVVISLIFRVFQNIYFKKYIIRRFSLKSKNRLISVNAGRYFLEKNNIYNIKFQQDGGIDNNYFLPEENTINLSKDTYKDDSIFALGVSLHEAAHAVQYSEGFHPLKFFIKIPNGYIYFLQYLYPLILTSVFITSFFKENFIMEIIIGLFFLLIISIYTYSVIFVEYNASKRVLKFLNKDLNILNREEKRLISKLLYVFLLSYIIALPSFYINLFDK